MLSPYITAIQKLAGRTPSEKWRTLRRIAQNIIKNSKFVYGKRAVQPSKELPEPLIPLVELEIALILKQAKGIIIALQSEDETIFNRALKAKWFFDKNINHYDIMHLLEFNVSVHHRMKIIKVLANTLVVKKLTLIAEEFYNKINKLYGHHQARRFLKACSESFIEKMIKDQKIFLSLNEVNFFFSRYPSMIIEYLKSQKNTKQIYGHKTFIENYTKFLPRLLKEHSNHFVEIILVYGSVNLQLKSPYHIELFLENQLNALIKDPKVFLPMLPTKEVIKKLTPQQIAELAKVHFPKTLEEFNFDELFQNIFMYVPQEQQISIIMSCFEDVYKQSLLNCPNKLTVQAMRLLPPDERVKQARKKLVIDKQWYTHSGGWYVTHSWRCYLPIEESIPLIKEKIKDCENTREKVSLLVQLIYTCRINDNKDALLDVLKYIVECVKNEGKWVWKPIFDRLEQDFQLQLLPSEHWDILYNIILNNVNKQSNEDEDIFEIGNVIKHSIHFDLIHNQLIIDKIKLIIKLNASNGTLDKWNIIEEVPQYEKKCLNAILILVPMEYSEERQNQSRMWKITVLELIKAIYNFNKRHCRKAKNQSEKLWVKCYPWLVDAIKNIFNKSNQQDDEFYINQLKSVLKSNEPDILANLPRALANKVNVMYLEDVVLLRRQPDKILKFWERYYRHCKKLIYSKSVIRFLRACRWYQDIPVKFMEQAITDFCEEQNKEALMIASTILDGPSFEKLITPCLIKINKDNKTFLNRKDPVLSSIQPCLMLLNPPISLNFVLKFCEPNYIHYILQYILYLGVRTPVKKLLLFCDELLGRDVSVRKHISRLLRMVVNQESLCVRLILLWRKETHESIRLILARYIFDCFVKYPSTKSWGSMMECLNSLTSNERNILDVFKSIKKIPNCYIVDYVRKLLVVFEEIGDHERSMFPQGVWYYTLQLFSEMMTGIANFFPEELHKELLEKYLINPTLPKKMLTIARKYLITIYIQSAGDMLDDRLKFFSNIFTRIVKNKWDEPVGGNVSFCPANYFVHQLTYDIVYQMKYSPIKCKLIDTALKTFLTLLQPQQEPEFYCNFSFASLYNDKMQWEEFTLKIQKFLPSVLEIFSTEFIHFIAKFLHKLINLFYGENLQLQIIELLADFNDDNSNSLAVALLLNEKKHSNDERFWKIFRTLRKHKNPSVTSSVYLAVHSVGDYAS